MSAGSIPPLLPLHAASLLSQKLAIAKPQADSCDPNPAKGHLGNSLCRSTTAGNSWQRDLADAVRDPEELCQLLGLDSAVAATIRQAAGDFPLLVPRGFVSRMQPNTLLDPLLLQVLPRISERLPSPGYAADPLHELGSLRAPGLVQKYAGRALLLVTGACAINCRYCFRREFPYAQAGATAAGIEAAIDTLAADPTIHEVILLADTRLACVVVVHANHPAELDESVAAAVARLVDARAILLNQAVLLAGVNDSLDILKALSERLIDLGIVPYYLHLLDRVQGTAHFEVPEERAAGLYDGLRGLLPGYAVPRLVREVPGEPSKVWLS